MSEENNQCTFENEQYRKTYWHTCSHVMAQAVKRLWPEVKLAIGPSIDEGWYYDMDAPFAFTPEHLEQIEAEMRKICKEKLKLERFELPRAEALAFMEEKDEPFKVELINDLPEDAAISFYRQGEFTDLCAGPHLDSTGRIKGNAIKLTACNAAYWRGDSNRQTLQRVYGIAFPKKDELDEYLEKIEEAKRRDHRKLGRELGLFMMSEEGPGFPFFLPKGMVLKNTLNGFIRPSLARLVMSYAAEEKPKGSEPLFTAPDAFGFCPLTAGEREEETVTLVGNLCTATDVMAQGVTLPRLEVGDGVAVTNAGSYAAVLSPTQFSGQTPPAELFLTVKGEILEGLEE